MTIAFKDSFTIVSTDSYNCLSAPDTSIYRVLPSMSK